ncbi:hypothetical protein QBC47DRAFT_222782 [Echria macrotheca]|uniref:Uncharacterized protein n=1 Tax=Echria macrotheca TaxID=438768 RepID=A0AAJ0BD88_9PEZI|nr:hypothetical protein QBC47DRAFT_222782 [Echria macrotheca]
MKNIISFVFASAAVVSAQVTYNSTDGTFTCAVADKNYCAGDSLGTDIIIRCTGTKGQPGRCTDNLAGEPPLGVQPALCYQSSPTAGDAACEKNCVVYGASVFTLPASVCTPYYTATSSIASSTSSSTPSKPTATTTWGQSYSASHSATATDECETTTLTTSTTHPTYPPPPPPHGSNSTVSFHPTGTTTSAPVATGAGAVNNAAGALAALGLVAAYLL